MPRHAYTTMSDTLTLKRLKEIWRKGGECAKARRFEGRAVLIWSGEHWAYWRANVSGYTTNRSEAGLYSFSDALRSTLHCGPEKQIQFELSRRALPIPGKTDAG